MGQLSPEVQREPATALFGGEDGLVFYRHIATAYQEKLAKGGVLVFEIGYRQAQAVQEIMKNAGYVEIHTGKDLGGNPRFVLGLAP